jgi:hypothetical protein
MRDEDNRDEYAVGYGKPPKTTRFKKGQSGNPGGRPRKTGAPQVDVEALLNKPLTVVQNGKTRSMSSKEIMIRAHLKKAVNGSCVRSMTYILELFEKHGAFELPDEKSGGLVTLPSTMPTQMAFLLLRRFGLPPWSKKQLEQGRAEYIATRSEEQKKEDDLMEYQDL